MAEIHFLASFVLQSGERSWPCSKGTLPFRNTNFFFWALFCSKIPFSRFRATDQSCRNVFVLPDCETSQEARSTETAKRKSCNANELTMHLGGPDFKHKRWFLSARRIASSSRNEKQFCYDRASPVKLISVKACSNLWLISSKNVVVDYLPTTANKSNVSRKLKVEENLNIRFRHPRFFQHILSSDRLELSKLDPE